MTGESGEDSTNSDSRLCWVFYFDDTPNAEVYAVVFCDDLSVEYVDNRSA